VRVELALAGDGEVEVQLTRHEAEELELAEGDIVYVRSGAAGAEQRLSAA
jgi:sulfate transport system ATP-binding protein